MKGSDVRKPEFPCDKIFLDRWSPRAMSGEKLTKEDIMTLFEAAKWAPSSFNGQPWRFIYATQGSEHWDDFLGLLGEWNQQWCKNAAVLVLMISRDRHEYNEKEAVTHSFDTGAAWENLALQGSLKGFVVHGMVGFDYEKARSVCEVPEGYTIEAMCAIGKPGKREDLPEEMREKENFSDRKKLNQIVFEGKFKEA